MAPALRSKKPLCKSCSGAVRQTEEKFPSLQIKVVVGDSGEGCLEPNCETWIGQTRMSDLGKSERIGREGGWGHRGPGRSVELWERAGLRQTAKLPKYIHSKPHKALQGRVSTLYKALHSHKRP